MNDHECSPRPVPVDPRSDSRPEARSIFNPAFVDVPEAVRKACVGNRRAVSTGDVKEAWRHTDWFEMPIVPLNGATTIVCREEDFMGALPHLGTAKLAYHAEENFVCRNYSTLFASVVAAELECNVALVCDDLGHHMYSAVPVLANAGQPGQHVGFLIIEPQGDCVVPHTDPGRHYVGKAGFALLV